MLTKTLIETKLLAKITGFQIHDILFGKAELTSEQEKTFVKWKQMLANGYPADYLLEQIFFSDLEIKITPDVLIPRPETEEWVNKTRKILRKIQDESGLFPLLVDIGTGSGVIGLSLSQYVQNALLVDISQAALGLAKQNAKLNHIQNTQFFQSDLLSDTDLQENIQNLSQKTNNWILVANLPYLPHTDKERRVEYAVAFEPELALYADSEGLSVFYSLIEQIKILTEKKNILLPVLSIFELDPRNIDMAQEYLGKLYTNTEIWLDFDGRKRVLLGFDNSIQNSLHFAHYHQ